MTKTSSNHCEEKDMPGFSTSNILTSSQPWGIQLNYKEHAKIFQTAQMSTNKLVGETF
jgi:hypothetical protein